MYPKRIDRHAQLREKYLDWITNFKGAWEVLENTKFVTSTWNPLETHSWDCAAAHNMMHVRFLLSPQQLQRKKSHV